MTIPINQLLDAVEWEVVPPYEGPRRDLPYVTHRGTLNLMGHPLECYVLSDGQRVFEGDSVQRFFQGLGTS